MSQGTSGSYAVNGVNFTLQPSTAGWVARAEIGTDGNNRPIYPAIRDFEMNWDYMPQSDLNQLIVVQLSSETGTMVFDLPKWGDTTYTYYSYSGTYVNEITVGQYFVEHTEGVKMVIRNIRTN